MPDDDLDGLLGPDRIDPEQAVRTFLLRARRRLVCEHCARFHPAPERVGPEPALCPDCGRPLFAPALLSEEPAA